jgi:hypothetical protein
MIISDVFPIDHLVSFKEAVPYPCCTIDTGAMVDTMTGTRTGVANAVALA